jgi:hypothetical protein
VFRQSESERSLSDISKAQGGAETIALVVAQYYQTLKRENVPDDVAQMLTSQYQAQLLQQAIGQQVLGQFGKWLQAQQAKQK